MGIKGCWTCRGTLASLSHKSGDEADESLQHARCAVTLAARCVGTAPSLERLARVTVSSYHGPEKATKDVR